ncbi:NADPH:adrenodoxin oxidoreductase [Babesia sp. Xinjiang]|uniref:NADPH:adrenodoxin oxidoreductase n=1 Tax=Babesia sp. Xinjiang TaxID=462227 RepID=UPI000A240A77|nr:NADPH:adrenodoxin oxidoreductase [Babesia sp. Xinjiang]ORM42073.1 NADPH:adrenodoxin oxidoreductase [Babesia sp. Xinjiang]
MFPRIAIVGAGPCGLYLAKNLRGRVSPGARVDIFDRLSQPLGLLRFGVAPDTISIRQSGKTLLAGATERFFFNVRVGTDLTIDELMRYYHVCLLSCGAESPRPFNISGDDTEGVFDALDIVRCYNGHPDTPQTVLSYLHNLVHLARPIKVCVVGNGNVALDVARILLTPAKAFEHTDISREFLKILERIDVRSVRVIGRRGIFQSSFTNPELRRITETQHFIPFTDHEYIEQSCKYQPATLDRRIQRRLALFQHIANNSTTINAKVRQLHFDFFKGVHSIEKGANSALKGLILEHNILDENLNAHATEKRSRVDADMFVKSIGFQRSPDSLQLLEKVDSKRIFSCGWFATNGKGDLSATLAATVQLSAIIRGLNFDFPVEEDILDFFKGNTKFKNVRVGNTG